MAINKTINSGNTPTQRDGSYEFSSGGTVEVKVKVKPGKTPKAKAIPDIFPASSGDFTLDRLVINLEVKKNAGEINPIELHVRRQAGETTLAYLSGGKWVKLGTSLQGDFLYANPTDWPGDPSIGIGHTS